MIDWGKMEEIALSRFRMFIGYKVTVISWNKSIESGILKNVTENDIIFEDGTIIKQIDFEQLIDDKNQIIMTQLKNKGDEK